MHESDIENEVCRIVEDVGGMALKLKIEGSRNFPDRTIIMPNNDIKFIEFKLPSGVLSEGQRRLIARMRNQYGCRVAVSRTVDDALAFLDLS